MSTHGPSLRACTRAALSLARPRLRASLGLALGVAVAAFAACTVERERDPGDTIHPAGFAVEGSPDFHATWLVEHDLPLDECRTCHGDDYHGGPTGESCVTSSCHKQGVESCTTCHGSPPHKDAHPGHPQACTTCHPSHESAREPTHPDGRIQVQFTGLAVEGGSKPQFHADSRTCTDVYCHGGREVEWSADNPQTCTSCHEDPPPSHAQFADANSICAGCHGNDGHRNGTIDLLPLACNTCHGHGPLGVPAPAVDGTMSGGAVGAHERHLSTAFPDRIGKIAACSDCHDVPASMEDAGHIDTSAPSDVVLFDGSYDASTRSCTTGCHWDRDPGPQWNDDSGAARACDSCHAMPPATTRVGGPHPPAPPDPQVCFSCHAFDPSTHVDGKVDFQ